MTRLSEQLEREAEIARSNLAADLDELRYRMTPGRIVDEVTDYARHTPIAEFIRNLARDIRDNPLPLLLIGAGIAWSIIASSTRRSRTSAECPAEGATPLESRQSQPAPVTRRHEWEVAAVTPMAVTPAAVTPGAVTPAAVTPGAVTPAADS